MDAHQQLHQRVPATRAEAGRPAQCSEATSHRTGPGGQPFRFEYVRIPAGRINSAKYTAIHNASFLPTRANFKKNTCIN